MSISQNFPVVAPTLKLNFAKTKQLDPRITFTRSSSGTYEDNAGILRTAAANQPRFDHTYNSTTNRWESRGLLLEESKTNICTYSDNFFGWNKFNTIVTPEVMMGPAGLATYSRITLTPFTSSAGYVSIGIANNPSTVYTTSAYLKAGTCRYVILTTNAYNSNNYGAYFDLQTGTMYNNRSAVAFSSTNVGNGWYRLSVSVDSLTGGSGRNIFIFPVPIANPTQGPSNNIDPSYNSNGEYLYAWGGQCELGYFATSYIPTIPTFTSRASSATFYDSSGILRTAATNVARSDTYFPDSSGVFRSAGLLLESAATNLLQYSEDASNSIWTKTGVSVQTNSTLNLLVAPNNTLTVNKIVEDTNNSQHQITQAWTYTTSTYYTASCYAKAAGRNFFQIQVQDNTGNATQWTFNLTTGTATNTYGSWVGHSASAVSVGNGWYYCTVSGQSPATGTLGRTLFILASDSTGTNTYTGDGTSGVYIWGAQTEVGRPATSYIRSMPSFTSRASLATYVDSAGIIRTVDTNVARSDAYLPDSTGTIRSIGLLYEETRTNLYTYSKDFSANWTPNNTTIAPYTGLAPDGTYTAALITTNTVNAYNTIDQYPTLSTNTNYCYSVFVKLVSGSGTSSRVVFGSANAGVSPGYVSWGLQLDTLAEASDGNIPTIKGYTSYPNGWYRIYMVLNTSSQTNANVGIRFGTGNVDSVATFYVWGAQIEQGTFPTSYIPTVASTVTRSADVVSSSTTTRAADVASSPSVTRAADSAVITGSNFNSFYNATESTLLSVGGENSNRLTTSSLTLNPNSSTTNTISNLFYYPKVIQYATLNSINAYPAVVTDGLVLNLDAGNSKSYPGVGTTWTDLSGNGNNGTLTNGPTYSNVNGGSIVFDGSNDYVDVISNSSLTPISMSLFCFLYTKNLRSEEVICVANPSNSPNQGWRFLTRAYAGTQWQFQPSAGNNPVSGSVLSNNTWYCLAMTYQSSGNIILYLNGIVDAQTTTTTPLVHGTSVRIGTGIGGQLSFLQANLSNFMMYNRALTATEVQQNFNATRRRYGI